MNIDRSGFRIGGGRRFWCKGRLYGLASGDGGRILLEEKERPMFTKSREIRYWISRWMEINPNFIQNFIFSFIPFVKREWIVSTQTIPLTLITRPASSHYSNISTLLAYYLGLYLPYDRVYFSLTLSKLRDGTYGWRFSSRISAFWI